MKRDPRCHTVEMCVPPSDADDTHFYQSVLSDNASVAVERLDACLVDVKAWLRASGLRLSLTKTQVSK